MNCPELSDLELFANRVSTAAAYPLVETHVERCSSCRSRVDEIVENLRLIAPLRGAFTRLRGSFTAETPSEIGPYEIVREIGRGGMGVVYEARQQNPQRCVALKVLHAGRGSGEYERLFRREVAALARLKHQHIAAIYEAGTTADGRSYFAMELVDGSPLTEYARRKDLSRQKRLGLFQTICEAIAYAHQRGVIHRDLKPSNIFVDHRGSPKILDFGLARVIEGDDSSWARTLSTEIGQVRGTLPYMSPEQVRGATHDIDVRSDVYSLGVVFYELLLERLPYTIDRGRLAASIQAICENPPVRPSTLDRRLRGDLETIILKALEKEPARRYASAAALADDVERLLHDQPILARPPTLAYQFSKIIARHKAPFAAAVGAFVLLVGFGAAMSLLYAEAITQRAAAEDHLARAEEAEHRATGEAERARQQAETANRVKDLMLEMFTLADPLEGRGQTISAVELLDAGVEKRIAELDAEPEIQAELLEALGSAYRGLGQTQRALDLFEQTLRLRRELGAEPAVIARVQERIGAALMNHGKFRDAEGHFRLAIDLYRELGDPELPALVGGLASLAECVRLLGRKNEAEPIYAEIMPILRRHASERSKDLSETLNNYGLLKRDQSNYDEAEAALREAIEIMERIRPDGLQIAFMLNNLGMVLKNQGRLDEAREYYSRSLDLRRELLGPDHPYVATAMNNLGMLLKQLRDFDGAESMFREALSLRRRTLGDHHPELANVLDNLASLLREHRRYTEAKALSLEALEIRRKTLDPTHPRILMNLSNLGSILHDAKRLDEAEATYRETLALFRATRPEDSVQFATLLSNLGCVLTDQKRYDEADAFLRESLDIFRRVLPPDSLDIIGTMRNISGNLVSGNRAGEGYEILMAMRDIEERTLAPDHWQHGDTESRIGAALAGLNRFDEAETRLLRGFEWLRDRLGDNDRFTRTARRRLEDFYECSGQMDQLARLRAEESVESN